MKIKENVKNINLKWIYIITGTFLMAIAYKSIYDSAGMVTGGISGISIINCKGKLEVGVVSAIWHTDMVH